MRAEIAMTGSDDSDSFHEEESPARGASIETHLLFDVAIVAMALGVFIVSIGYALSRSSKPGAIELYFVGEFLVAIAPLIFLYKNKRISNASGLWMSLS